VLVEVQTKSGIPSCVSVTEREADAAGSPFTIALSTNETEEWLRVQQGDSRSPIASVFSSQG
jgi:hypothetical protein